MKKLITLILIAAIVMANIPVVLAEEIPDSEYIINLDDIPYEEIIMPPWFVSPGLPYIIEPDMAVWLVFYNMFLWYRYMCEVEG